MPPKKQKKKKPIETYQHGDKDRLNNPPVGLVREGTDSSYVKKKTYEYDPHLDPQLQWAGKTEHTSFEVPTVSLHVHERIDPKRIIHQVRNLSPAGGGGSAGGGGGQQLSMFEQDKKPLREAIEFYKHRENWSNRLIAGDSLLVMNSLLEKEGMGGKVQMVYIDPPYGIKYGSNFQPFVNKRDVKDGKDEDLTAEPEMIKAFRDTWELGIHSYLTYLRDRLLLARELITESGSVFVQISDENVHHVREVLDEVFGNSGFCSLITFQKSGKSQFKNLSQVSDYLLWYSKNQKAKKFRTLYREKKDFPKLMEQYRFDDGDGRLYRLSPINSQDYSENRTVNVTYQGKTYHPGKNRHWSIDPGKIPELLDKGILTIGGNSIYQKLYLDSQPGIALTNIWDDTSQGALAIDKIYVVQTNEKVIQRCLHMTTDPGDLVLDITCGGGTSAYVAEKWGRRWITCDTSRVAITLAKQRLMTANFDYYDLAHPQEGVGSGFKYKTVPHITLKSIANNEPAAEETLYDQPYIDNKRTRVTGPFTVEAVPAPVVKTFEEVQSSSPAASGGTPSRGGDLSPAGGGGSEGAGGGQAGDTSVARSGETLRQDEWRQELLKTGVRAKGGRLIQFTRVEPLGGTKWLQAEAETKVEVQDKSLFEKGDATLFDVPKRVLISFGPEHAPLEQRQVELALEEAEALRPKPDIILFCAFQFDAEAAKDIDEMNWPGVTLLKVQMNADLQTDDLKKKRSSNESFWLIGQPDVELRHLSPAGGGGSEGAGGGKYQVAVHGFDYYNPKNGNVESGGTGNIAMWLLDTDYDGRSLFPSQVFFPMAGPKDGWAKLSRNLKAEIDEEKIEAFRGTVSLPFEPGKQIAVKIIDDRGIESFRIIRM